MSALGDRRVAGTGSRAQRRQLRDGQLSVLLILLALAGAAWAVSDLRMAGMDAGPGTDPGAFGFYISTWVVMMAAMMFPSIAPMVLTFRRIQVGRDSAARTGGSTGVFISGYLVVWAASGLLAYSALKLGRSLDSAGLLAWHRGGRWLAAGVLLAAAAYELTPVKAACLARCRSPLGFLVGRWRGGRGGALRMGAEHGGWCLGCCWMLMVGLFALGVMSIVWMIVVSILIAAEKLLPARLVPTWLVTGVLAVLAVGVAAAPGDVPGLTIPGSARAMHAMGPVQR